MAAPKTDLAGNPILPRVITHWGDGATALTNRDVSADLARLDVNLSRAALGANIAQKEATGKYGINSIWTVEGSAMPATTVQTVLNVSGFGKLHQINVWQKANAQPHLHLILDNVEFTFAYELAPSYLSSSYGSVGERGVYALDLYDGTNGKYILRVNGWRLGGGAYGSSCKVELHNSDSIAHEAAILINYLISASEIFKLAAPAIKDPVEVRQQISQALGLPLEASSVAYYQNWDTRANKQAEFLDVHIHPELSPSQRGALLNLLRPIGTLL